MKADFSKIIRDSIQITKTNKKLWVMGLVLVTLTAGGSSGGGGGNSSNSSSNSFNNAVNDVIEKKVPLNKGESKLLNANILPSTVPQVLGAATSTLSDLLKTIPATFYVTLVLIIILVVLMAMAVSIYGQAWSQSGLIQGINRQSVGESLGLGQMSEHGKKKSMEVIKLRLIPGLIFGVISMVSVILLMIPLIALGDSAKALVVMILVLWLILVAIAALILGGSINLGVLAINLENLNWKEAFRRGFKVFKTYFIDVAIMSLINCCLGCLVGFISLIVILILGAIGVASVAGAIAFPPLLIAAGPIVFLAMLVFLMFTGLAGAIFTVFKQSTWVLLYKQLTEESSGQQ